jgi:hypothetical protein
LWSRRSWVRIPSLTLANLLLERNFLDSGGSRFLGVALRALTAAVVSGAVITAFGAYWLDLPWPAWLWMVVCEIFFGYGAVKLGLPALPPWRGHPQWPFHRYSPGSRLLAVAVVISVLGAADAAIVVRIGHQAGKVTASVATAAAATTTTTTTTTTVTTPSETRTSSSTTKVTVTRTPSASMGAGHRQGFHHYGWRLLAGALLGWLAAAVTYLLTLFANLVWTQCRDPDDPFPIVVVALLHSAGRLSRIHLHGPDRVERSHEPLWDDDEFVTETGARPSPCRLKSVVASPNRLIAPCITHSQGQV